jgi:hypothetical protein
MSGAGNGDVHDGRRSGSPNAGTVHAVRREATRHGASEKNRFAAESEENAASVREPGDSKRVKRHET